MAIAVCPKCKTEFLAAEQFGQPELCPACGEKFILSMAAPAVAPQAKPAVSPGGVLGVTLAILLGLAIDALLAVGSVWHVVDARMGSNPARGDIHAPVVPLIILLVGLAGHAVFSLLAIAPMSTRPARSVTLGRIGVGCWLLFGTIAVFGGVHLWPSSIGTSPETIVVLSLVLLGVLMTYLGGLEWLSQKVSTKS
ncbi:MAG: hypothetical protein PHU85_01370 [Phycisphaerae bacterium]|nr:hypothetical protein [Phycisphaerae bacterium]